MPRTKKASKKVSILTSARRRVRRARPIRSVVRVNPSIISRPAPTPFRDAGSEIGGFFGFPKVGAMAGSAIGRLFGSGVYKLTSTPKSNTLLTDAVPEFGMVHSSANSIRIRHREYLSDISSSIAFTTQGIYYINPGLQSSFPWLSQIASSFQQYKIHGLCAVFKSTSADAVSSTNAALGAVVVSFNFNPTEPIFTNKQQMLETDFACDEKPTVSFVAPMECARSQTALPELYVRQQGLLTGQNQQFYDMAVMQVATQGSQAAFTAGELWITYDIELIKPISSLLSQGFYYHLNMATSGTISTSNYFGSTASSAVANTGSNFLVTLGATTITFPAYINSGKWMMFYSVVGSSTAVLAPTVTFTTNCSALNSFVNQAQSAIGNGGSTSILFESAYIFTITGASAVITFSAGTLPASATSGELILISLPTQGTQ